MRQNVSLPPETPRFGWFPDPEFLVGLSAPGLTVALELKLLLCPRFGQRSRRLRQNIRENVDILDLGVGFVVCAYSDESYVLAGLHHKSFTHMGPGLLLLFKKGTNEIVVEAACR
ncbi:MAG: hypothetical protein AAF358_11130 [Pseudomonadota bacterium]